MKKKYYWDLILKIIVQIFFALNVQSLEQSFTHQNFEDILIKNNYEYIYTYGINRYYVDKNLDYLKERAKFIEKIIL